MQWKDEFDINIYDKQFVILYLEHWMQWWRISYSDCDWRECANVIFYYNSLPQAI